MIQLRYGEDGLDGMWVENQVMPTQKLTNVLFEKEYKVLVIIAILIPFLVGLNR